MTLCLLTSCSVMDDIAADAEVRKSMKYKIETGAYMDNYWTNSYNKDKDGCISFLTHKGKEAYVCGSFNIVRQH